MTRIYTYTNGTHIAVIEVGLAKDAAGRTVKRAVGTYAEIGGGPVPDETPDFDATVLAKYQRDWSESQDDTGPVCDMLDLMGWPEYEDDGSWE